MANNDSSHSGDLILTIDNGTQSVRALLFDLQGQTVASAKVDIEPYFSRNPGWAEQEPEYYWKSLCQACQLLWQKAEADETGIKERVRGVTLTTQRGTYICVDEHGKAIRPAIVWLDQRRAAIDDPIGGLWGPLATVVRLKGLMNYFRSRSYSRWLSQNEPQNWQRTRYYLLLSGWHTLKMTGQYRDSVGGTVGYLPFNSRKLGWAPGWDWTWRATCLKREQLPELVKPGEPLGSVTKAASADTGIPEGLPLIAAGADKACEVIGSGCYDSDTASISYGTTATINVVHDRYREPQAFMPPWPAAIPDAWNSEFMVYRGYWMVSWFKATVRSPGAGNSR